MWSGGVRCGPVGYLVIPGKMGVRDGIATLTLTVPNAFPQFCLPDFTRIGSLQNIHGHMVNRVTPDHARTFILTLNLTLSLNPNTIFNP